MSKIRKDQVVYEGGREAEMTALNYDGDRLWQVEIVYKDGTPPWNCAWVSPKRLTLSPSGNDR